MKDSPNLDLLRSMAVLFVVASHLGIHLHWGGTFDYYALGRTGVAIFFVHTTLVLMGSLERQGGAAWPFLIRRFFRIYPLSVTVVMLYALFNVRMNAVDWSVVASNLLLIQNLTGHASQPAVLWSLPLEVQMYLVLPALFALTQAAHAVWRIAAVWAASVCLVLLLWASGRSAELVQYVPAFLPGAIAFTLAPRVRRRLSPMVLFGALLLAAVLISVATALSAPREPLLWVLCLGLGVLIPISRELTFRPIVAAAKILVTYSYGIYLMHLIAIVVAFAGFAGLPRLLQWLIFLAALATLSIAGYRWIERPCIELGKRIAGRAAGSRALAGQG